jgi:hypothetical protein
LGSAIPYKQFPDRTVADIQQEWARKRDEYEAWEHEQRKTQRTFLEFLAQQGLSPLHDHVAYDIQLHWLPRTALAPDDMLESSDTLPRPEEAAAREADHG